VSLAANGLTAPYRLVELGIAGAFVVRAFMAHGEVPWHKHMDQDESFLVWQGRIELESQWGELDLAAGELAVVPKGVGHRSSAERPAIVLQMELRGLADRRNGERRLLGMDQGQSLAKARLTSLDEGRGMEAGFREVAHLDGYSIRQATLCGQHPWHAHGGGSELYYVHEGALELESIEGSAALEQGEMATVPRGVLHRLVAEEPCVILTLSNGELRWEGDE